MAGADEAYLREYLAEQDIPCPACGYNLRGLAATACPECGQELVLGVHLAKGYIGLLIGALAPLIAIAGASALVLGITVCLSVAEGRWPTSLDWYGRLIFWSPLLILLVFGAGAVMLASPRGRRWFRRRTERQRALIVVAAAAVAMLIFAAWTWQATTPLDCGMAVMAASGAAIFSFASWSWRATTPWHLGF